MQPVTTKALRVLLRERGARLADDGTSAPGVGVGALGLLLWTQGRAAIIAPSEAWRGFAAWLVG
jgi:hypothetical protein